MGIYYEKSTNLNLFLGTKFACAGGYKTKGCKVANGKQVCYCEGAECNKYTKANFYSPGITIFIEILSFFHPARFDNFKDEKISGYKTVSFAQNKNLLE